MKGSSKSNPASEKLPKYRRLLIERRLRDPRQNPLSILLNGDRIRSPDSFRRRLNENAVAYYDSLMANEIADASAWGDLGAQGLAAAESHDEATDYTETMRGAVSVAR